MKTLFSLASLLIVAICFSSCLRYQYRALASDRANNQFYVSKLTGFGGVMLFWGIVTLLGFGVASKAHN
jgi:hypothetical protein